MSCELNFLLGNVYMAWISYCCVELCVEEVVLSRKEHEKSRFVHNRVGRAVGQLWIKAHHCNNSICHCSGLWPRHRYSGSLDCCSGASHRACSGWASFTATVGEQYRCNGQPYLFRSVFDLFLFPFCVVQVRMSKSLGGDFFPSNLQKSRISGIAF